MQLNTRIHPCLQGEKFLLTKMSQNQIFEFEFKLTSFTEERPWLTKIFQELHQELNESEKQLVNGKGFLELKFQATKKWDQKFQERLLITGQITGTYSTPCVKCLELTQQSFDLPLNAIFVSEEFQDDPEYLDQDVTYAFNQELDLYFYHKKEVFPEQYFKDVVFLNLDPLPLHDANCKGLCQFCGSNLNGDPCPHEEQLKSLAVELEEYANP